MRIAGYIVLIIGIGLELLMLVGELAQREFQPAVLTAGLPFIGLGAFLVLYGKGTGRKKRIPRTAAEASVPSLAELQGPTRELPITPAISQLISARLKKTRKVLLIMAAGMVLLFLLLGVGLGFAVGTPRDPRIYLGAAAMGLLAALTVLGIGVLAGQAPLRRDLQEFNYLRTAGPIELWVTNAGHMLRMSDRSIMIEKRPAEALRSLKWATVDYSRNAKLVFAAWDRAGNIVYRLSSDKA